MKKNKMLLIAAAAALFVSCGNKGGMTGDNSFPVETVKTQSATLQSTYPAVIRGIQDVEIRPKVSGFITKICVNEGQTVKAGQLLFVIDNVTYEAAVNTASASLNTAKLTYENSKKLYANKVIGSYELQSAQNSFESAQAQLAQAKASLASAKENLNFCYVKSPANGVVGTLPYDAGALVSASSVEPLTVVSDVSTMEAYFSMNEKEVLDLTKEAGTAEKVVASFPPVHLQLADGSTYQHEGKVAKVSGVIDEATGSVQMIAQFPNPEHLLKSGGSGSIVLKHTNPQAIVVPKSCTVELQNKIFVYLLGADNKAKYTEITVEPQNDGNNYVVTGGLKPGDKYVTNGITKLTDGAAITPITPEEYAKRIKQAEGMGAAQK